MSTPRLSSHNELCQEYNCIEGMQEPPADAADADVDGARADGDGPRPTAPLSLPPLNRLASQHVSEDEEACRLPPQRCDTSQVMRHWTPHTAIAHNDPSARQRHLDALHKAQAWDAISRTKAGESHHSILQSDVPDGEEMDCEPSKRHWSKYTAPVYGDQDPVRTQDRKDAGEYCPRPAAQAERSIAINMAGGGAQGHVAVLVLSVHWFAHSQAEAGCLASAYLPLQSAHH